MTVWLGIKGAPGYAISSEGQVKNTMTGRILKPFLDRPNGYEKVKINGRNEYIHVLIANNFFENIPKNNRKIIYIDGCRTKNSVSNLKIIEKNSVKK